MKSIQRKDCRWYETQNQGNKFTKLKVYSLQETRKGQTTILTPLTHTQEQSHAASIWTLPQDLTFSVPQ